MSSVRATGATAENPALQALMGHSPAMVGFRQQLLRAAQFDLPVLLQGETGTGKELAARGLHGASPRAGGPFVAFNCAGVVDTLFESELFGHARGAFTGANRERPGLFQAASGGTLFLDEVGDMAVGHQAKVLRVLECMEVRPVGSSRTHSVDVRVIAATHVDLRHAVAQGRFRLDLYFRLAGTLLTLPPLRERGEDLLLLARHFLDQVAARHGLAVEGFTPDALAELGSRAWQGNVRELRRTVESGAMQANGPQLGLQDLGTGVAPVFRRRSDLGDVPLSLDAPLSLDVPLSPDAPLWPAAWSPETLAQAQASHVARVLAHAGGNRSEAARILGVSRRTLYRLIERHGLR